jgi:ubiquinone/menaquinone biosynthesis C-methylase UbiE
MKKKIFSPEAARKFYDFLGPRYDWFDFYEGNARARGLELLCLTPGQSLLEVGVGTGKDQQILAAGLAAGAKIYGLDISHKMASLALARARTPTLQADAHSLPFAPASFDCLFTAFVLDLVPTTSIPEVLSEFWRVLRPGGRAVLVSLTGGINRLSHLVVGAWKLAYAASPVVCGGCRPLQLSQWVKTPHFEIIEDEVVVQFGVPCEILAAKRLSTTNNESLFSTLD